MARYNLTQNETRILTSWLFEPEGYLDGAVNASGVSARQALAQNANLDVAQWIRTNTRAAGTAPSNWSECALVWWIRANSGADIVSANMPPESAAWEATLNEWSASIDEAFNRMSEVTRNGQTVTLTTAPGGTLTMNAGAYLANQKQLSGKVTAVLA